MRGLGALRIRGLRLGDDSYDASINAGAPYSDLIDATSTIDPFTGELVSPSGINLSTGLPLAPVSIPVYPYAAEDAFGNPVPPGTPGSTNVYTGTSTPNAIATAAQAAAAGLKAGASIASINAAAARQTSPYLLPSTASLLPSSISSSTLLLLGGGLVLLLALSGGKKGRK